MLAQDALEKPTNLNLYQRKREIEPEIKVKFHQEPDVDDKALLDK